MTTRIVWSVLMAALLGHVPLSGQVSGDGPQFASRYVDPANGVPLEEAIARALAQEPSLRAARSEIEVARGMRLQAALRPNPAASFERREEPGGTDNQTTIAVQWPLDLFRKGARVAVADREIAAVQLTVADRERVLAAEVRSRYGEVLVAIRDLAIFDELVAATRAQHALLRSRVDEGASPRLERDLLEVELRRLESERLLQAGETEAALFALKRILGMSAVATLTLRETLPDLVQRGSSTTPAPIDRSAIVEPRADVREAAARVDLADARINRSQREGRFDVTVFANYMQMDAGFPQRGFAPDGSLERVRGAFSYISAGAMVTIPVLNRNQGEVAAARAERAGAAAAHDAVRLAAEAELAAARARDEHARSAVALYTSGAQRLAQQNLTVVRQSYELGRVTVFEVLAEQRRYLDVERAYTAALRAAYEARTALKRALGDVR